MSLKHPNAVQETTTVTGTGDAVLLGAALGRLPFSATVNNGDTVRIQIEGVDVAGNLTGEFEISLATYNGGPNSLTRSVVETSSNSNNLVVFSTGTKRVYACSPTNNDLTTLSTPAASALTGTTLAANVVTSSLTTIGTLVAGSIPYSLVTGGPSGTVTSVSGSGGTTGLTLTGGPITSSGTLTLGGALAIANGGSGQITANAALNAFLPTQTSNNGKFLTTDGTNTSWGMVTGVSGANPTGTVGLAAVNGSAATFLRSDGAPALSQAIVPTWTSLHTFQAQTSAKAAVFKAAATTPDNIVEFQSSGGTALSYFDSNGNLQIRSNVAVVVNVFTAFDGTAGQIQFGVGKNGAEALFMSYFPSVTTSLISSTAGGASAIIAYRTGSELWQYIDGTTYMTLDANGNLSLGTASSPGGGKGVLFVANAVTVPASNPSGGGIVYTDSGALKYRGSSGTVTILAPA